MIPRHIYGATHRLGAPKDWDASERGKCSRLMVRIDGDVYASAWEPTPEELQLLNAGASVVLHVVGGQPPVALTVERRGEVEA